ncbi:MAG: hypothetical protein U9N43_07680, partial [Euryarchaeota archaeon]|nr:hypothetical protein [Euryarchaeota archaeon]
DLCCGTCRTGRCAADKREIGGYLSFLFAGRCASLQKKCVSYIGIYTYYKIQAVKMSEKVQLERCMCEVNFIYGGVAQRASQDKEKSI